MNPAAKIDGYSSEQLGLLHDAAKQRAERLRSEALDDFWHGIADVWSVQQLRARRAAERLASRIARHSRLRSTATQQASSEVCC